MLEQSVRPRRRPEADALDRACPGRDVIDCGPDATLDLATCSCQGFDNGRNPWGGQPGCLIDDSTFPGAIDQWPSTGRTWADDMPIGDQVRRVLRAEPGPTVVVTPPLRLGDFSRDLGSGLEVTYHLPEGLADVEWPGQTLYHVTIPGRLTNEFVGQIEHADLPYGAISTAQLDLAPEHLEQLRAALSNDEEVRITAFINTDPVLDGRNDLNGLAVGLAGLNLRGATRPLGSTSPDCPRPADSVPVDPLGPWFEVPGDRDLTLDPRFRELIRE